MKKLVTILIIVSASIIYYVKRPAYSPVLSNIQKGKLKTLVSSKNMNEAKHNSKISRQSQLQDEVMTKYSAIQRTAEEKEIEALVNEIIKDDGITSLDETIKQSFLQKVKDKKSPQAAKLIKFIDDYNLLEKIKESYAKLHPDDLRVIAEIQNHPLLKSLKDNQEQIQAKIRDVLINNKEMSISPDKVAVINQILEQSNEVEASQVLFKSLIKETVYETLISNNEKITIAEARGIAEDSAVKKLKKIDELLTKSFLVTYGHMKQEELEEYLRYTQKIDARRATKKSMDATGEVLKNFISKLLREFPSN